MLAIVVISMAWALLHIQYDWLGMAQIFAAGFEEAAGVKMINVPFKGDSDGAIALAGSHIDVHVAVPVAYKTLIQATKIRFLRVSGESPPPFFHPVPAFPDDGLHTRTHDP